jgi:putative transposase
VSEELGAGCFETSEEIIRLAAMIYVRFPLSLRKVEDLLHERRIG